MAAESSRGPAIALFVSLAVAAAFVVSAIAGLGGGPSGAGAGGAGGAADPGETQDSLRLSEIRVEVLNGAGTAGLARDVTHRLREDGFDVVFFGNAGRFDHDRSVVLDRIGAPRRARAVAVALRIDSVASAVDSTLLLDVSVVLGDDWPPPAPAPDGLAERARSWLQRDSAP